MELYILIGLPGSGKDTFLEHNKNTGVVLSRDIVRNEIGIPGTKPQGNFEQEEKVTKIIEERFRKLIENHDDIVINNTNLKKKYRLPFENKAREHGYDIIIIYFNTPIRTCIERRKDQISEDVIKKMWMGFEFPTKDEYDSIIYIDPEPVEKLKKTPFNRMVEKYHKKSKQIPNWNKITDDHFECFDATDLRIFGE